MARISVNHNKSGITDMVQTNVNPIIRYTEFIEWI